MHALFERYLLVVAWQSDLIDRCQWFDCQVNWGLDCHVCRMSRTVDCVCLWGGHPCFWIVTHWVRQWIAFCWWVESLLICCRSFWVSNFTNEHSGSYRFETGYSRSSTSCHWSPMLVADYGKWSVAWKMHTCSAQRGAHLPTSLVSSVFLIDDFRAPPYPSFSNSPSPRSCAVTYLLFAFPCSSTL